MWKQGKRHCHLARVTQVLIIESRIQNQQADFKAGTLNLEAILSLSTE